MSDKDTIYRQQALDAVNAYLGLSAVSRTIQNMTSIQEILKNLPSAQPERVWTPCDIPPKHHRDVIVRGVEAIGGECVYKVMQWDVDTWRPKNYAPSITWLDWSEI